jgi:hypothetical protein
MVIKSSETKSDQPFLELYKKLSKEVVAGGEKLLKEIQDELSEYKSSDLSVNDSYSRVRLYYDFGKKRILTTPILGTSVRISDILTINSILNYSLESFHNSFGDYIIKTINKKKINSLSGFELYTKFYIDRDTVLNKYRESLICNGFLSSESFDSKYFELFSSTNKKKSREPMVVMFSDKDEAEEFLKFMADKYSKKYNSELLMYFVLKLNQDVISEKVFNEVLDVLLSKMNESFQEKERSNFLDVYFNNDRLIYKILEEKIDLYKPTEKECNLFSETIISISTTRFSLSNVKYSPHKLYIFKYLLSFLNKKNIAFVTEANNLSESMFDPLKEDSIILISDSMLSGQILWNFTSKKSLNLDILSYLDDKVRWLKYWNYDQSDVDKYSNRFSIETLSIRDLLSSKNFYLLPLQKNLLSDVLTHLRDRNALEKDELELLNLLENVKVAEWDKDRHLYKTDNGYFKPSDIQKKSFILKK